MSRQPVTYSSLASLNDMSSRESFQVDNRFKICLMSAWVDATRLSSAFPSTFNFSLREYNIRNGNSSRSHETYLYIIVINLARTSLADGLFESNH